MDKADVWDMVWRVPKLNSIANVSLLKTAVDSNFRKGLFILFLFPLFALAGDNQFLGFKKPVLRSEYKIKPDYLTGKLFYAERKDIPQFKYF